MDAIKTGEIRFLITKTKKPMRMRRGEDIEHYADKYEERQEVLRQMHESSDQKESFPEEDERESRKMATSRYVY
jgi:hypothetical protein